MAQDPIETEQAAPWPTAQERDPLQRCEHFIPGLRSMPWWDAKEFSAVSALKECYQVIRSEFLNLLLCGQLRLHPQSKGGPRLPISDGDWNIFELISASQPSATSKLLAPRTTQILMNLPEVTTNPNGLAYFSVLSPGVHIATHCGPTNSRIRIHLGLLAPEGAVMRVGNETRPWREGDCIVFDDSWEHEVFNRSEFVRAVLLFDVWHPDMNAGQIGRIIAARSSGKNNRARQQERAGWLDIVQLRAGFTGASLCALVGPDHLGRMMAAAALACPPRDRVFSRLRAFAAQSLDQEAARGHAEISADLWSGLATLVARQPDLLSREDVVDIIHIASVSWRSAAENELLGWKFMEQSTDAEREKLFTAPRRLSGVCEILKWCHEEGRQLAPLSLVAAAATLAIQEQRSSL
jgi:aspartyl/asparaginyl beta-hydroxylase (cupin superfamily)